ncbi:MAG: hypothetical protein HZB46_01400, partial [Solirubrobacterales bacterium]|nr:hypothetical protein [Solirubrobacterales bacterium]
QPREVAPTLAVIAGLLAVAVYGVLRDSSPATLNNVAFALFHVAILTAGAWPALARPDAPPAAAVAEEPHAAARRRAA